MKILFICGYLKHNWSEWGGNTKYEIIDVLECDPSDISIALKKVKEVLLSAIENKELDKNLITGGEGDLGGHREEFQGEFFSKSEEGKKVCSELNAEFRKILGEIFILPNK